MAEQSVSSAYEAVPDSRQKILRAAEDLIADKGIEAATTRAVADAAGVQAPTLYRLFGDKDGLLNAVADQAMSDYVAQKTARPAHADPLEELRAGWDTQIEFGLSHPGIFTIMTARPALMRRTPAVAKGLEVLKGKIRRLAETGGLIIPEDMALDLMHASATGTIFTLLSHSPDTRNMELSIRAREATLQAMTGGAQMHRASDVKAAAITLNAGMENFDGLSAGEKMLVSEILTRISNS